MKKHPDLSAPPSSQSTRFEKQYPLAEWLDGTWTELENGTDFKVRPETLYQGFQAWAKREGVQIELAQRGKNVWVRGKLPG
jgi:hypothetical protein